MPPDNLANARMLRKSMSLPEILLWNVLRQRPAGLKFRRQHPMRGYVLDFFCREAGLAIEVDGAAHDFDNRPERDVIRDRTLRECGILTMRIPAADVLNDLDAVVRGIVPTAQERVPLHHPAAPDGPPPRAKLGED